MIQLFDVVVLLTHKLYSTVASVLCLCDVSVICHVTYFQFPIQSAFLQYIAQ